MEENQITALGSKIGTVKENLIVVRNEARRLLRKYMSENIKVEFPESLVDHLSGDGQVDLADSVERQSVSVTAMPDTMVREVRGFVSCIRYDENEEEVFVDLVSYTGNRVVKESFRIHEVVEQENLLAFVSRFAEK